MNSGWNIVFEYPQGWDMCNGQLKKGYSVRCKSLGQRHDFEVTDIQAVVEAVGIHKINQTEYRDDKSKQQ